MELWMGKSEKLKPIKTTYNKTSHSERKLPILAIYIDNVANKINEQHLSKEILRSMSSSTIYASN